MPQLLIWCQSCLHYCFRAAKKNWFSWKLVILSQCETNTWHRIEPVHMAHCHITAGAVFLYTENHSKLEHLSSLKLNCSEPCVDGLMLKKFSNSAIIFQSILFLISLVFFFHCDSNVRNFKSSVKSGSVSHDPECLLSRTLNLPCPLWPRSPCDVRFTPLCHIK